MARILCAACLVLTISACSIYAPLGPSQAAMEPECRAATPGNSVPGFRCTGDYTGDGGTMSSGR
ncbi:MAG: hypothetical protein IT561_27705 [Alphaproteobacteria bacterium]|nr:hypothetical protein [Alphaproteobacteria bacterium]